MSLKRSVCDLFLNQTCNQLFQGSHFGSLFVLKIHHFAWASRNITFRKTSGWWPDCFCKFVWHFKYQSLSEELPGGGWMSSLLMVKESFFSSFETLIFRVSPSSNSFSKTSHYYCLCSPSLCSSGVWPPGGKSHDHAAGLAYFTSPLLVLAKLLQVTSGWPA